jgi:hypothetical protein
MVRGWEDLEKVKAGVSWGAVGDVCWLLGIIFAVLRVVGDAANVKLGLEPTSWFLLAIVVSVLSVSSYIYWAVAWYLRSTEAKSKKKE